MKDFLLWNTHSQRCVISQNMIFDEKSIILKLESADGVMKTTQDNMGKVSDTDDLPLTSTSDRVQFEMELGRHGDTPMKGQQGEYLIYPGGDAKVATGNKLVGYHKRSDTTKVEAYYS